MISVIITGPPNGPALFSSLASVVSNTAGRPAGGLFLHVPNLQEKLFSTSILGSVSATMPSFTVILLGQRLRVDLITCV